MNPSQNLDRPVQSEPQPVVYTWQGHMDDDVAATFGSEPLAKLTATGQELVVSGTRGTHCLKRESVLKVTRASMYPWFFSGLKFHHNAGRCPKNLQFKPLETNSAEVLTKLRALGYPVV